MTPKEYALVLLLGKAYWVGICDDTEQMFPHRKAVKGDLVLGKTAIVMGPSDFSVGWVEEVIGYAHCMIREIGSDRTADYGNEDFQPIEGWCVKRIREIEAKAKAAAEGVTK